jgi:dienelactone hydrolase
MLENHMSPILPRLRRRFAVALALCTSLAGPCALAAAFTPTVEPTASASLRAVAAAERDRPRVPRISRAVFLAQPMLREARLSPDGRKVAALVENGQDRSLWLATANAPNGRRLLARTSATTLAFSHDGRWLFLPSPTQVYALAMSGQAGSGAIAAVGGRSHREFAGVDPWRPAAVLLLERPRPATTQPRRWRLLRSAIGRPSERLLDSPREIVDFAFAPDGTISHVLLVVGEGHALVHRGADGGWRRLARCERSRQCRFVGTRDGGRTLLMRSNVDGDLMRLLALANDGTLRTLHGDPRGEADLQDVVLDPRDGAPLLASYRSTVPALYALHPSAQPVLAVIARRFPDAAPVVEVGGGAGARWLVRERNSRLRGERLHLFDTGTGADVEVFPALSYLQARRPVPRPPVAAMARQVPVAWTASDGLRVHGFLWLPPGLDAAHAPMVVSVHGGPFGQVAPDYGTSAQFLANRGYVVFAPNFRSSTGLGRRYVLGGQGDFGGDGRVQRDIVEGTRWLLAQGIGDPERVGIAGASFGGYSTLLGLSFQPGLFKVGVASVPPSDFAFVIGEYIGSGTQLTPGIPMAATMRHLGVDPADRALMARLHAGSPVANVARMRRPLLLLAGGEDDRVPIRGVTDYAARLHGLGRDVSLLVDAGAGHNIADPRTREAYLYLEEVLLHRHLGGAAPEPPGVALREHLRRTLRMASPDLARLLAADGVRVAH